MDNENEITPENVQETQNEEVVTQEENTTDELSTEAKLAKAQAEANKWRRIAEKNQKPESKPRITSPDLAEELKLIARGLSDEEIEKAKVIAKGNGTSLTEALNDDMFITYQTKLKEDKRREDAKLGGTHGSGESQDNSLVKADMTREEHVAAFNKVHGI